MAAKRAYLKSDSTEALQHENAVLRNAVVELSHLVPQELAAELFQVSTWCPPSERCLPLALDLLLLTLLEKAMIAYNASFAICRYMISLRQFCGDML